MKVSAKNYWTKLLPMCIKKTYMIPTEFYYLITPLITLQERIDIDVIEEYISDPNRLKELIEEIIWTKRLVHKKAFKEDTYSITSSYSTNEVEDIIKTVFKVTYINDEFVEVTRY